MRSLLLILVVSMIAACGISLATAADYEVVYTSVIHSNGAVNPYVASGDEDFLCGYEYPCGGLTGVGRQMMESLGGYLRTRYNNESVVDTPFLPSTHYNISLIHTRSIAVPSSLQSATSVLLKLFPDMNAFNPAVDTVNETTDTQLNVETLPRAFTRNVVDSELREETLGPVVSKYFGFADLQALATEAHVTPECSSRTELYRCARALHNVGMAFQAAGRLSETPSLSNALPNLVLIDAAAQE